MLVVSTDAVDPQPHSAKDADDDGGDWPVQHLAAADSSSLIVVIVADTRCSSCSSETQVDVEQGRKQMGVAKPNSPLEVQSDPSSQLSATLCMTNFQCCCQLLGMSQADQR